MTTNYHKLSNTKCGHILNSSILLDVNPQTSQACQDSIVYLNRRMRIGPGKRPYSERVEWLQANSAQVPHHSGWVD